MDVFAFVAERRIREAMETGVFDNLQGAGEPLDFSDERNVPKELRAVFRVLKNAGCLPPELEMRKEVRRLQDLLPSIRDEERLRDAVREINLKITALNMMGSAARSRSVRHEVGQIYVEKMLGRLVKSGG